MNDWLQVFFIKTFAQSFQWNICLSLTEDGACSVHAKRSQEGTGETAIAEDYHFWLQLSGFCKSVHYL